MADPTLLEVVEELKKQTDLLNVSKTIAEATKVLVSKPGGGRIGHSEMNRPTEIKPLDIFKLIEPTEPSARSHDPALNWRDHKPKSRSHTPTKSKSKGSSATVRAANGIVSRFRDRVTKGSAKSSSGMGGKGGGAAKAAGAVGAVIAVAGVLNEFRKSVIGATEANLANARKLKDLNGDMSRTFANEEIKELFRGMRSAKATAASTDKLSEANQRRKDAQQPIEDAITNLTNELLTVLNEAMVPVLKTVSTTVKDLYKFFTGKEIKEEKPDPSPIDWESIRAEAARIERENEDLRRRAELAVGFGAGGFVVPPGGRP